MTNTDANEVAETSDAAEAGSPARRFSRGQQILASAIGCVVLVVAAVLFLTRSDEPAAENGDWADVELPAGCAPGSPLTTDLVAGLRLGDIGGLDHVYSAVTSDRQGVTVIAARVLGAEVEGIGLWASPADGEFVPINDVAIAATRDDAASASAQADASGVELDPAAQLVVQCATTSAAAGA